MSPEASLRTWMPAVHAGMTKFAFSFFVGERKTMEHFVMISIFLFVLTPTKVSVMNPTR
jgi:hypothetical protein